MSHSDSPTYPAFTELLSQVGSDFSAAQMHGYLCGFMCSGSTHIQDAVTTILGDGHSADEAQALAQTRRYISYICEESLRQLVEMEFSFRLLLPEDDQPLDERSRALGDWCFGFVSALENSHVINENCATADVLEVLQNFQEISEIDYDNVDISEEDEVAFTEVLEYARMGVILVFTQLDPTNAGSQNNSTLH